MACEKYLGGDEINFAWYETNTHKHTYTYITTYLPYCMYLVDKQPQRLVTLFIRAHYFLLSHLHTSLLRKNDIFCFLIDYYLHVIIRERIVHCKHYYTTNGRA